MALSSPEAIGRSKIVTTIHSKINTNSRNDKSLQNVATCVIFNVICVI